DWYRDAGAQRPAGSPERRAFHLRSASELAPRQLIVGPGKPARSVEQPGIEYVAQAAAYGSRRQHGVLVARPSDQRRGERLRSGNGVGEHRISLEAQEDMRRRHPVVAGL